MSLSSEPKREHPSTYVVEDRTSQKELTRLQIQDYMLTTGMGGVLAEQPDPTRFRRVLDVGCGTGGWLIELAKTIPDCTRLIGVDASRTFVEYARAQAEAEHVSDRVEFFVADALRMLEFPDDSFDLVNHRVAASWLRTWDWHKLLEEYQRVCSSIGIVRITEADVVVRSTSSALMSLCDLWIQAFYQAGHLFTPTREGVTEKLVHLLQQHGFQQVQTRVSTLEYRAGTANGQRFSEDAALMFRTVLPFICKWTRVPDDFEELYQQMLSEMQQPDFVASHDLLTVWGNPSSMKSTRSRG